MWEILKSQMLAALATLNQCLENWPDPTEVKSPPAGGEWDGAHADGPFSQWLFHALFYLDYYLSRDVEDFKAQQFHSEHRELFRNYEELEDKEQEETYTKDEIKTYIDFCRDKIERYFGDANKRELLEKTVHRNMTVLELAINNTRHVQHHAAELGLYIEQITGKPLKWVSQGWT